MERVLQMIRNSLILLLAGGLAGTLLLAGAFLLPLNRENVKASRELFKAEGWYPAMPVLSQSFDTHFHSYLPGVLDDSTDMVMFETTVLKGRKNVLAKAMSMDGYSYYWHGYVMLLRPLLLLFDFGEIRVLNHLLQMFLLIWLGGVIWKKTKKASYLLALGTFYFLLFPLALGVCLQFSWVFYIAVAGTLCLIARRDFWERESRFLYVFLVLGMLTSYFDLLTYPLLTWGFPILWWLVLDNGKNRESDRVKQVVVTGLCWIAGYGLFWVLKWLIGSLILRENIFESAWSEVFFRMGGTEQLTVAERLGAVYTNWKHYEYKMYALALAAWLLWGIGRSIFRGWGRKKSAAYLLTGFSGIVWYLFMANHTLGHHFFTYRIFSVSILAFLVMITECTGGASVRKFSLKTAAGWCVIAVASLGMAYFAREERLVTNGNLEAERIELSASDRVETTFTPTYFGIINFGPCIESKASEGTLRFSLEQDGQLLYEEEAELTYGDGTALRNVNVNWRLKAGQEYRLCLEIVQSDTPVYLLVYGDGEGGLAEFAGVMKKGEELMRGEPMVGITYRSYPFSKKTILFLALTWMGVFGCIAATVRGETDKNKIKRTGEDEDYGEEEHMGDLRSQTVKKIG